MACHPDPAAAGEGPPLRSVITLETESAQSTFCEICHSARDNSFSHKSHPPSKFPPLSRRNSIEAELHKQEPVLRSPAAGPTLRAPTISRPTSFQKSKMDRAAR